MSLAAFSPFFSSHLGFKIVSCGFCSNSACSFLTVMDNDGSKLMTCDCGVLLFIVCACVDCTDTKTRSVLCPCLFCVSAVLLH